MRLRDMLLAVLTSLIWGFAFVTYRFGLESFSPAQLTVLRFVVACLPVLFVPRPKLGWGMIALIGLILFAGQFILLMTLSLVQLALPYVLFSKALEVVEAHRASLIVLLEALFNPLWTYLVVGEAVPRATLIGGPFILAGVVGWMLLSWRRT